MVFLVCSLDGGHLSSAGTAPAGPEVNHKDAGSGSHIAHGQSLAVGGGGGEVGKRLANGCVTLLLHCFLCFAKRRINLSICRQGVDLLFHKTVAQLFANVGQIELSDVCVDVLLDEVLVKLDYAVLKRVGRLLELCLSLVAA